MNLHMGSPRGGGDYGGYEGEENEVVSEINTTPLVDIMLVLLIIFLITIPVATRTVKLDLPTRLSHLTLVKPGNIVLAVTKNGETYLNEQLVNHDELTAYLKKAATFNPQPQVQIRGDSKANYGMVGQLMQACQQAGIVRVDFITQPPPR